MDIELGLKKLRSIIYSDRAEVPLDDNDIVSVLLTYPACMVAAADGVVDQKERAFLLDVSEQLSNEDAINSSAVRLKSTELYRAFMWLLENKNEVEEDLLVLLKDFLSFNPETKKQILEVMREVASISDGTSQEELDEINRICLALDIKNHLN